MKTEHLSIWARIGWIAAAVMAAAPLSVFAASPLLVQSGSLQDIARTAESLPGIGPIQDASRLALMNSEEHQEHVDHEDICTVNRLHAAAFIPASKDDSK